jgi:hypothetical protein
LLPINRASTRMDIGLVVVGIPVMAGVFTILDSLGFVPNGPHMLKRIKARIEARRNWREAQSAELVHIRMTLATLESASVRQITALEKRLTVQEELLSETRQRLSQMLGAHAREAELGDARFLAIEGSIEALKDDVFDNLGELNEAVRIAQNPAGARVEQMARDHAKLQDTPRGVPMSDAPLLQAPP